MQSTQEKSEVDASQEQVNRLDVVSATVKHKVSPNQREEVFRSYLDHSDGHRVRTENVFAKKIREIYPGHHVIEVDKRQTSLVDFAEGGNASCSAIENFGPYRWNPQKKEVECDPRFGWCDYNWADTNYIVYSISWMNPQEPMYNKFFIIHPELPKIYKLIQAAGEWTLQLHDEVHVFEGVFWRKDAELFTHVSKSSWDKVFMDVNQKTQLIKDINDFFDSEEKYKQWDMPWRRGVLLHGPPGNGKTTATKSLMYEAQKRQLPLLYVRSFNSPHSHSQEDGIKSVFEEARRQSCVVVLEDLDKMVGDKELALFLNLLDGLQTNHGNYFIATVNNAEDLDPALGCRPSRFDQKYLFQLPTAEERTRYLVFSMNSRKIEHHDGISEEMAKRIADLTNGYSYAGLQELVLSVLQAQLSGNMEEQTKKVEPNSAADAQFAKDPMFNCFKHYAGVMRSQFTGGKISD